MKIILIILFSVFAINLSYGSCDRKPIPVNVLELKYSEVFDVLSQMYLDCNQCNWNKAVFVVNVKKHKGQLELKTTILYKEVIGLLLQDLDKRKELFGCFEFNQCPVLVFGDQASVIFSKTNGIREFEWLGESPGKKNTKRKIEEPPIIFEPEVWEYKFEQGTFLFVKKGVLSIFD